jgi:hypothetical protein
MSSACSLPFIPAKIGKVMEFDFIFDTNAVRSLGELPDNEWEAFVEGWDRLQLSTYWIPVVLAEVVGTNLSRKAGLKDEDVAAAVKAVRRFDILAERRIQHDPTEVMRRSIYALLNEIPPPSSEPDRRTEWRAVLDNFLDNIKSAKQIKTQKAAVELGVLHDGLTTPDVFEVVMPTDFSNSAQENVEAWKEILRGKAKVSDHDRINDLFQLFPVWAVNFARNNNIPMQTIKCVFREDPPIRFIKSAFALRAITEHWYYHLRASGEKSSIKENDGRDLALSTYLGIAWALVSDDGDLRGLLKQVLADERCLFSFADLKSLCMANI